MKAKTETKVEDVVSRYRKMVEDEANYRDATQQQAFAQNLLQFAAVANPSRARDLRAVYDTFFPGTAQAAQQTHQRASH